jgi:tRNA(fMet)-specific endonuclease VapC
METILLDTDVFSFVFKGDTRAQLYAPLLQGHRLALSFVSVGELFEWAKIHTWGARRLTQLEKRLSAHVIVPVDLDTCRIWGNIRAAQRLKGQMIATQDAWVAAAAIRHQLPLITHNKRHYESIADLEIRSAVAP